MQRHRLELAARGAVESVRRRDLAPDPGDVGLGVGDGDARPHPADHAQVALAARPFGKAAVERLPRLEVVGDGGVGRHHQPEAGRHHPDDDRRPAVDVDPPADDAGIAAVAPLPHRVAQQDRGRGGDGVVIGLERAAERGLGAEQREVVGGDEADAQLLGIVLAGQRRGGRPDGAEAVEPRGAVVEVLQLGTRERRPRIALGGLIGPHEHQPIRIPEGQRLDQQRVGDAEDGGVGGDAEGQGGERRRRRSPAPCAARATRSATSRSVSSRIRPMRTSRTRSFTGSTPPISTSTARRASAGVAAVPAATFGERLDEAGDLGVELVVGAAAARHRAPDAAEPGQPAHASVRVEDQADRGHDPGPVALLGGQLAASRRRSAGTTWSAGRRPRPSTRRRWRPPARGDGARGRATRPSPGRCRG